MFQFYHFISLPLFLMPVWHSAGMEIDLTLISCAFCLIPAMSCQQWPAITTYPSKNWTIFCPNKCLRSELIQFHCHTTRQNNVTLISFSLLRWSPASVFLSWSSRLSTSIYRAKGHQHFSGLCMTFFKQEILQIFVVFLHTFGHEHFVSCKANKEKWQILKNIAWEKLHWADTWYLGVESSAWKSSIRRFVITEKAPTRAFSWLKAATTAFTFKTLC